MQPKKDSRAPHRSWLERNWRMAVIVVVGLVLGIRSFNTGSWLGAVCLIAMAIGVSMNIAVMVANGGRMPVDIDEDVIDEVNHHSMQEHTRLRWLCDWIPCGPWMLSPGDVVLYAGLVVLVFVRVFSQ